MNKRKISVAIGIVVTLALLAGGWVWYEKRQKAVQVPKWETRGQQKISTEDTVDAGDWKVYRNERYGFEMKYPKNWIFEEREDSGFFDQTTTFRYVTFSDPTSHVHINFGVKKETESSVVPREYNTGIPGGDFSNKGTVRFGDGIAEERDLIDCYTKDGKCVTELIWFCKEGGKSLSDCRDFSVGFGRVAFLEARDMSEKNAGEMRELLHEIIQSFHFVR